MKKVTLLRAGTNDTIQLEIYPEDSTAQIIELAKSQFGIRDKNCVLLKSDGKQITDKNIYQSVEDGEKLTLSPTVVGGEGHAIS